MSNRTCLTRVRSGKIGNKHASLCASYAMRLGDVSVNVVPYCALFIVVSVTYIRSTIYIRIRASHTQ